ncbi:hypothetical protein ILYODFUR_006026 [Ilyodon furcidens]|uniref:Uncharacterized protein n=1 Tax=Ilyodon furcidens TaxID=33524 RepID=A0ABV0U5T1_9TELE
MSQSVPVWKLLFIKVSFGIKLQILQFSLFLENICGCNLFIVSLSVKYKESNTGSFNHSMFIAYSYFYIIVIKLLRSTEWNRLLFTPFQIKLFSSKRRNQC